MLSNEAPTTSLAAFAGRVTRGIAGAEARSSPAEAPAPPLVTCSRKQKRS